jgi:phage-related protein
VAGFKAARRQPWHGLFEVRTTYDKNEYRALFCIEQSTMMILQGFQKKTQKTPVSELRLARMRQKGES